MYHISEIVGARMNKIFLDPPRLIQRAQARCMTLGQEGLAKLSVDDQRALVELLRCVSKTDPSSWFFIKRETLQSRLKKSQSSVGRYLLNLKKAGLIEREQLCKSQKYGYRVSRTRLTKQAVHLLWGDLHGCSQMGNLPMKPSPSTVSGRETEPQLSTPQSFGSCKSIFDLDDDSDAVKADNKICTVQKEGSEKSATSHRGSVSRVPLELRKLLADMKDTAIFKLMKLASLRGVSLQEVLHAYEEALSKPSVRSKFKYLEAILLNHPEIDLSYLIQKRLMPASNIDSIATVSPEVERKSTLAELDGIYSDQKTGERYKVEFGFIRKLSPGHDHGEVQNPKFTEIFLKSINERSIVKDTVLKKTCTSKFDEVARIRKILAVK
jgi:DNA-binding transcriptional ArsR family regulator